MTELQKAVRRSFWTGILALSMAVSALAIVVATGIRVPAWCTLLQIGVVLFTSFNMVTWFRMRRRVMGDGREGRR